MTSFTNSTTNYPEGANTPIKRVKRAGAPTSTTVKNFVLGDEWLNTTLGEWWKLTNNPAGGVAWVRIGSSGGTTPIDSVQVDTSSGSGTNPVLPTVLGLITITGGQTAPATISNVIRTDSLAANAFTIEIQQTSAVSAKDVTKNGVAHFNSTQFNNDGGFISILGGAFTWNEVTVAGPTQMTAENGYIANTTSPTLCSLLLPASAVQGASIQVVGKGTGLFRITQNAGQTVRYLNISTTTGTGGSLSSTEEWAALEIVCITANTEWAITDSLGGFTVV